MIKKLEQILSRRIIVFSIIAALGLIVYSNSFSSPFTLDDFGSISNNYSIRNPLDLFAIWKFYSNRFIIYFTFSLNFFVHQTQVEGYHIVNIIIHIFNGILVFLILYTILGLKYFEGRITSKYRNLICTLSALIFISHPVQINAVTYVVQRTASLASTFYFLSILFFMKYRLHDKVKHFLLMLLFILLAMFTKENTITIPFMLILIEFMFFLKDGKTSWVKRIVIILILLITVPIIPGTNLFLGGYSQSDPGVSFKASTSMDRFQYFYTQMNVITNYIHDLVLPNKLVFDYSNDYSKSTTIWENHSYLSFSILLIIGIIALLNFRRNKLISFGILWFYIGLAVESSFISIKDVYFEHRLYFPIVGFIMCMVGAIFHELKWKRRRFIFKKPLAFFLVSFCFMILMFSTVTLYRNYIFSNNIRLWTDVTQKAPKSDRAHCILGTNYLDAYNAKDPIKKFYLDKAETELNKSLQLYSLNDTARCNLSKVYLLKKEYQKCIDEASKVRNSKFAYYNAGSAYEGLNQKDKALESYLKGLKVDKKTTFILKALGKLYYEMKDYKNSKYYYEEFIKYNIFSGNKDIKEKLIKINELISDSGKQTTSSK
jgi:protein O-mannosyl-transferase